MTNHASITKQIEELIVSAEDPKDKAFLLILNRIATNLEENTAITRKLSVDLEDHTTAFRKHEETEMALLNQGRGAIRVALYALAIFQAAIVWYTQRHIDKVERIEVRVETTEKFVESHRIHHQSEHKK